MNFFKKFFKAISKIFRSPEEWKLDYLHNTVKIGQHSYSPMLVDLHAKAKVIDPRIRPLGDNPPPQLVGKRPDGISQITLKPYLWYDGEERDDVYLRFSNKILYPTGGGFEKGLWPQNAQHAFMHWILDELSDDYKESHPKEFFGLVSNWRD